jgi:hypothetical protein
LRKIDFPFLQSLDQLLGRDIDQLDGVRPLQDNVGQRLADDSSGDLSDDVVQAFYVLDVERRVDVDARLQELFDVLPALRMPRAFRVRVGQLVDEDQLGVASQCRFEVEFPQADAAIWNRPSRKDFQPFQEHFGLRPTVRFDVPHDDIHAIGALAPCGFQHGIGLSNTRCVAEKDFQLASL